MEHQDKNRWKIESLRLTSFLKDDFNGTILENWLTEISKIQPLSINKRLNYFQGLAQVDSAMLKLEWNTDRLDLILSSNAPMMESHIGDYTSINSLMQSTIFKIFDLKECPASRRLAIGVVLNAPIKSMDEGIDFLQSKLKSVTGLKGSTDFLFRINKPVQSDDQGNLKLNRLMTWSIGQLQLIQIPLGRTQANLLQPTISEMVCRLEMDFNSDEKVDLSMSVKLQKAIANELLTEALNVAEKGEFGVK